MGAVTGVRLIDIAVNLTDGMFKGIYNGKQVHASDVKAVLARAWDAGVDRIIVTGGSLQESKDALELADTDARLYCTVGVHPTRCLEFEESGDPDRHMQQLSDLAQEGARRGKVVAVGECGLDYDRLQFCPKEVQQRYFERHFDLAERLRLPMFLHMRAAADDFVDIVQRNKDKFVAGVSHSFTGSMIDLEKLLSIDHLYVGINGCSLKTEENVAVMAAVPLERMMIETDSPYCEIRSTHAGYCHVATTWPSKKKEKHDVNSIVKNRNEPCQIRQVLEVVAGRRGIKDLNALSNTLYETTSKVFFHSDFISKASTVSPLLPSGDCQKP